MKDFKFDNQFVDYYGDQQLIDLHNDYTASIICTPYSYGEGLFEIAFFKDGNLVNKTGKLPYFKFNDTCGFF